MSKNQLSLRMVKCRVNPISGDRGVQGDAMDRKVDILVALET